jgi:hypothetical protein
MHLRIAERLEKGWRGHLSNVRSEIAMHCERSGEHARAARHKYPIPRTATIAGTLRQNAVGYG